MTDAEALASIVARMWRERSWSAYWLVGFVGGLVVLAVDAETRRIAVEAERREVER